MAASSRSSTLTSTLTSEDAYLALIDRFFPAQHKDVLLGRGDDCAVLRCPSSLCLSTDLFLEDVHFRRSYFAPEDIGYKALAVNISDIAAMGAKPLGFALNLMIPDSLPDSLGDDFWVGFFQGMAALADTHGLYLAGGDLSRSNCLGVAVTIWGAQAQGGRLLRRGQGRPGDILFIVGDIGLARTGLALLEEHRDQAADFPAAMQAHLRPIPRVREGALLATMPSVCGLMDVSDGLIRDLPRFLGPALGCRLNVGQDILHPEVLRFAAKQNKDPLIWALRGGEDYALLGAVAPDRWPVMQRTLPQARHLGVILNDQGMFLGDNVLQFEGFDHFQPAESAVDP